MKWKGFYICITILCIAGTSAHSHELPLLFQERYLYADFSFDTSSLGVSAFSGDFPLVIHAEKNELSLYTGDPLFLPLFLSAGTTNQIGYQDSYREHTPAALFSIGWRPETLGSYEVGHSGWFASWGWRSGFFSGGISYHFTEHIPVAYLGASFHHGAITTSFSQDSLEADVTFRLDSTWSLNGSVVLERDSQPRYSIGFGFSRKDYAADALLNQPWDLRIAHRGSLEHAPENSDAAFQYALSQPKYIGIEADIQKTADNNFVMVHDPVLFRYTKKFINVNNKTTDELKTLDMGSWFSKEFANERIMDLKDFAELCNQHPDVYWLIEIKSYSWTEEDVVRFLTMVDKLFQYPDNIAFYTLNLRTMALMQKHSGRPVGLQLDSRNYMLFLGDHILPLLKAEFRFIVKEADFFTILSSKYDRYGQITSLADELEIPVMFWNFHDNILGYIPDSVQEYPLGMRKMESGAVLLD